MNGDGKYNVNDFLEMSNNDITRLAGANGKFDVCLQKPPYDKNLHLKFIRKVMQIAKTTINISPMRWLQDPFAQNKRSTLKQFEDVAKHIESIEQVDYEDTNMFDMSTYSRLGFYVIKDKETDFDYYNFWKTQRPDVECSIIEKVCLSNKTKKLIDVIDYDKRDGVRVLIAHMGGNRGALPIYKDIKYAVDGFVGDKDWTECKNMGGYVKPKNSPIPQSIKFNTENEADNFWESYNLHFFKVICDITIQQQHIQLDRLPFLDSYKNKITNNQMYKLFNLTPVEIKFIEDYTIEKLRDKKKRGRV